MRDLITVEALNLDTLDADGAIREAEEAVAADTRADFFRKAAIGGGSLIGGGVLLSGLPALAEAKPSKKSTSRRRSTRRPWPRARSPATPSRAPRS